VRPLGGSPKWFAPTLVGLTSVVIGAAYPTTIYNPIGYIDPFIFVGLGLDYDISTLWSWYYKVSRLPWIVVEYSFRHALPPIAAQYAIQYTVHALLGLGFYFAAKRLLGSAPAFLGAVFLVSYTDLYSASAPDYMATFAAALYALFFWALTVASQSAYSYPRYAWCGFLFAMTVHTDFLFLLFLPMLVAHAVVLTRAAGQTQSLLRPIIPVIGGAAVATLALCIFSAAHGRDFNFMMPQIKYTLDYIHPEKQSWYRPWSEGWWYGSGTPGWGGNHDPYFGAFVATAIASLAIAIAVLRSKNVDKRGIAQVLLAFEFVYALSVFIVLQSAGQAVLQPPLMMVPLVVPFVMALAVIASWPQCLIDYEPSWTHVLMMWLLIVAPLCVYPVFRAINIDVEGFWRFALVIAIVTAFAAAAALSRLKKSVRPTVCFVAAAAVFSVLNIESASAATASFFTPTSCTYEKDGYLVMVDLNRALRDAHRTPQNTFIWTENGEMIPLQGCGLANLSWLDVSFTAFGLVTPISHGTLTQNWFKSIESSPQRPYILVATTKPEAVSEIRSFFQRNGLTLKNEEIPISEGGLRLHFVGLEVAGNWPPSGEPATGSGAARPRR